LKGINGIEPIAFSQPNLALEHFRMNHQTYRIVISDYRMPDINGIEMFTKMKEINPVVTRILTSAFEIPHELFQRCNCVDKFLQKPISMDMLINEVRTQINH
jgi:response regulator RpfG family c-di-GMP phosphodiesterase